MKKRKNKTLRTVVSLTLLLILVVTLAAMPLLARQEVQEEFPISILSAQVEQRELPLTLAGGGSFESQEALPVTIPKEVKLTEFAVKNGSVVAAGDPIAYADRVSVMAAIAATQEELTGLEKELETARSQSDTASLTAPGGVVKTIYAQPGDSVQQVMLEHGALAVISLDGRMEVTLEADTPLASGDPVTVTLSGKDLEGRVESNLEGTLVVTLPDEDLAPGAPAQVTDSQGNALGEGVLAIHNPWHAVAYSGTVDRIFAQEGSTLRPDSRLITLKDLGYSAEYRTLAARHREYEEQMLTLFKLYQDLTLRAPGSGLVSGIDEHSAQLLAAQGSWQVTLLKNAPGQDPDAQYVNFVGQVQEVGSDGVILKLNPQIFSVTDYADLSGIPTDPALMTQTVRYSSSAPVYQRSGEDWVQVSGFSQGDILLFAGASSGNVVWAIRISGGTVVPPTEPSQPTQPSESTQPSQPEESVPPTEPGDATGPTDPTEPVGPTEPTTPGNPGGSFPSFTIPSFGGSYSGGLPGMTEQQQEGYTLDTVEVAAVTPTDSLSLPITIDQLDIHHVALGQTVTVTAEALPGRSWLGTITQLGHIGENSGGSSKFTVTVTLPREEDMLPGMHAAVTIPLDTLSGMAIPVAALGRIGNQTVVYTALDPETGEPASPVEVTPGASDGEYLLLATGPRVGTTIYYPYYEAEAPRQ